MLPTVSELEHTRPHLSRTSGVPRHLSRVGTGVTLSLVVGTLNRVVVGILGVITRDMVVTRVVGRNVMKREGCDTGWRAGGPRTLSFEVFCLFTNFLRLVTPSILRFS